MIRDLIGIAVLPLRWVARKAINIARGYDPDREYNELMASLREEQIRQANGL